MKGIRQSGSFNETTSLEIIDPFASVSSVLSGTKALLRWSRRIQENLHKKFIRRRARTDDAAHRLREMR
jgi:hypothetical protein